MKCLFATCIMLLILPAWVGQRGSYSLALYRPGNRMEGAVIEPQSLMPGTGWGYIDRTGKMVIQQQFVTAGDFSEGLAQVRRDDREQKWGFIDKTGKIVIAVQFDWVGNFSEG